MIRPWTVVMATALSLAGGIVGAQFAGAPKTPSRKEWDERYRQFTSAFLKKDYRTFRQMTTPATTWVLHSNRKLNPAQMQLEYARKLASVAPNTQFTLNITKLTITEKEATVERTQVIAGFYYDPQGKRHQAFDGSGWEDRWTRTPQGWKLKMAKQFNETLTIDGRPGDPYVQPRKHNQTVRSSRI